MDALAMFLLLVDTAPNGIDPAQHAVDTLKQLEFGAAEVMEVLKQNLYEPMSTGVLIDGTEVIVYLSHKSRAVRLANKLKDALESILSASSPADPRYTVANQQLQVVQGATQRMDDFWMTSLHTSFPPKQPAQ